MFTGFALMLAGASKVLILSVPDGAPCQRRIPMNTITAELVALDTDTGLFCADFGWR